VRQRKGISLALVSAGSWALCQCFYQDVLKEILTYDLHITSVPY